MKNVKDINCLSTSPRVPVRKIELKIHDCPYHAKKPKTIPTTVTSNGPPTFNEMAPLEAVDPGVVDPPLADAVEDVCPLIVGFEPLPITDVGVPVDHAVDNAVDGAVDDAVDGAVDCAVDETAEEDKLAPTAFAAARKLENELFEPSAPGLTANTIPLPQWLAAVFSLCRQ
jgi:hypothetical protein